MVKVLVTGATGLLGCSLVPLLQEHGHQVTSMGKTHASDMNIDLTCSEQTARALGDAEPDVIVNLAALTNVDRCETHPQEAYLLNVKTVENISTWIRVADKACHLVQVSTDQVYDGPGPHAESDVTICNFYGMSKLAGELIAGTVPCTILRTNFVGRSICDGRASLTDWLHAALIGGTNIKVFEDVIFSPIAIRTLCYYIERCVVDKPLGVFNLGSADGMSKADFAFAFATALGFETNNVERVRANIVNTLVARRPTDMRMQCGRFEACMNTKLPLLIDETRCIATQYI
jgi:dTDP-4-dehydrorhamnose reductase